MTEWPSRERAIRCQYTCSACNLIIYVQCTASIRFTSMVNTLSCVTPRQHLNTVFHALVMSRILYALPVWGGYLSAELIGQINSLLKRAHKYGFTSTLHTVENMADLADKALFEKILAERHCLHGLLPTKRVYDRLRPRGHSFELPSCTLELHKRSFIPRCLYKYI